MFGIDKIPSDLVAIKDETVADCILYGFGFPDILNQSALLSSRPNENLL